MQNNFRLVMQGSTRVVVEKTKCEYKMIVPVVKWDLFSNLIAVVEIAV